MSLLTTIFLIRSLKPIDTMLSNDPLSGSVYIDGYDIKTLNLRWLRSQLGL
ncbi:unnamed protein product, partial [Didymodactylos carnosus]